MTAIAICGSPRANGNSEALLKQSLEVLAQEGIDGTLVSLRGKDIQPCVACGTCGKKKDGQCSIKNDDFAPIFEQMKAASIIIVGSPVYFGSATPQLMALLDRAGYVSRQNGGYFSRKLGGPIVVARRAGQNFTFAQLLFWFLINDMIVPGSSYWNIAFGREPGEVENDAEGLGAVQRFSQNLAWLASKLA
jgi:multimeric flavodoxin WrbA